MADAHTHHAGWKWLDLVVAFAIGALVGILVVTVSRGRGISAVPDTPADLLKE